MQLERYLDRIGYTGRREPTGDALRDLHRAHLLAVPFENLDIAAKRPIILETELLLHKIVDLHRGGFCYELNGAFSWLLQSFGFEVKMLSARVARRDGGFSQEFDHMTLEVRDGNHHVWLADVGFGDCFLEPLSMTSPSESQQGPWTYRLLNDGDAICLQRKSADIGWTPQYQFTRTPHRLEEFAPMCRFHQTSPESSFTQRRFCSLATPNGRITLEGMRLITTQDGQKTETKLAGDDEYRRYLQAKFGVEVISNKVLTGT